MKHLSGPVVQPSKDKDRTTHRGPYEKMKMGPQSFVILWGPECLQGSYTSGFREKFRTAHTIQGSYVEDSNSGCRWY